MDKIKVIILDDHDLFRLGIKSAIENCSPDIQIVGEAKTGTEFYALLKTTPLDIVLLDIVLPDISGIEIAQYLKREYPSVKILVLSSDTSSATIEEMLNVNVEGFISKLNCDPNILAEAIRSVMQGFEYFGKDISDMIRRIYIAKKQTKEITSEFSETEKRIIECCHEGLSAKMISNRLDIPTKTIEWHKSSIFRKLGINSTLEMVHFAIKNKIIKVES